MPSDPSGIPHYDRDLFYKLMRTGSIVGRDVSPIMIWGYYRNMTDEDLDALWAWVRTIPPIRHRVDNTETPTACGLCGQTHGLGEMN